MWMQTNSTPQLNRTLKESSANRDYANESNYSLTESLEKARP